MFLKVITSCFRSGKILIKLLASSFSSRQKEILKLVTFITKVEINITEGQNTKRTESQLLSLTENGD